MVSVSVPVAASFVFSVAAGSAVPDVASLFTFSESALGSSAALLHALNATIRASAEHASKYFSFRHYKHSFWLFYVVILQHFIRISEVRFCMQLEHPSYV